MKEKRLPAKLLEPARRLRNRYWVWRAGRSEGAAPSGGLPEPNPTGEPDRGARLLAGFWPVAGGEIALEGRTIWQAALPTPRLVSTREGFDWLDDLAAFGGRPARNLAQAWVQDWIARRNVSRPAVWRPEIAGRRAMRWIDHARFLTEGQDASRTARFWQALSMHQSYLRSAWEEAPEGLPRLRALGGLVWTGRVLPYPDHAADIAKLGEIAAAMVGPEGGVASRRPEDLALVLDVSVWTARLLEDGSVPASPELLAAIVRIVPVLRQLRMGGGLLPCFHGGGPGDAIALDKALAELRLEALPKARVPMGYVRLAGGRVVVILDAAEAPSGPWAKGAHASALAFEMSIGRQPVVGNQGPGARFGADWAARSRTTPAHCTVEVEGASSARIRRGVLGEGPTLVSVRQAQDATGMWLLATHDGYAAEFGLIHERRIFVDMRGTEVRGEEILNVTDARARQAFDRTARRVGGRIAVTARFHLHPNVAAEYLPGPQAVLLTLAGGEVWEFRAGGGQVMLEPSVHFDVGAAAPRETQQVVVRAEVVEYLGQITWSFGRIVEAPRAGTAPRLP